MQKLWDNFKRYNTIGLSERENETEKMFKIMIVKNFPTLQTNTKPRMQEAQRPNQDKYLKNLQIGLSQSPLT